MSAMDDEIRTVEVDCLPPDFDMTRVYRLTVDGEDCRGRLKLVDEPRPVHVVVWSVPAAPLDVGAHELFLA